MGSKSWRGRKFGDLPKKEVQKRGAHKKALLKKRTKMNLTSLHKLRKSQIGQPMLFFEQRARPPEVAAPAQKIRGILESSRDERRDFQPRTVVEFPVGQEVAQIGWAMPSDGELLDRDVVS
jgi:hypothetical protein